MQLVLSLFPGIDLLGRGFEADGFCVVRGPDVLWGGDIHDFHPPAGRFDGVIGGPPCQAFSRLAHLVKAKGHKLAENLIPEFERCVSEAIPEWFLMENVPQAPTPFVPGYAIHNFVLSNRWILDGAFGAEQNRERRLSFGVHGDGACDAIDLRKYIDFALLENFERSPTVCASGGVKPGIPGNSKTRAKFLGYKTASALKESIRLQGLPNDFLKDSPFTLEGKHQCIGNGVPLPMGRAIAKAIHKYVSTNIDTRHL